MEERKDLSLYISFGVESPQYLGTMLGATEEEANEWLEQEAENQFSGMQGLHGVPNHEELCEELGIEEDFDEWTEEDYNTYITIYNEAKEDWFPTWTRELTDAEREDSIDAETGESLNYLD